MIDDGFYCMDCFDGMAQIDDKSVDMILCDLPYGTTQCSWDVVIPFEPLWAEYKRIIKDNGAIVLFGMEPFSSYLRLSNIEMYKYDWIWDKVKGTGFLNAKKQPMRNHEVISVFYKQQCKYHPQMSQNHKRKTSLKKHNAPQTKVYGKMEKLHITTQQCVIQGVFKFFQLIHKNHLFIIRKSRSLYASISLKPILM